MVGVTQRSRADRALRLVTDWCSGGSLQELLNDAFGGDEARVRRGKSPPTVGCTKDLNSGDTGGVIVGSVDDTYMTGFVVSSRDPRRHRYAQV